jgi:hypothetical protein
MIHDVISAEYKGGYRIELTFDDGKKGTVDFTKYLSLGGVFERLRDLACFRQFKVDPELGVLTWGNDVDIAPETLYADATGGPLPDWMMPDKTPAEAPFVSTAARKSRRTRKTGRREAL